MPPETDERPNQGNAKAPPAAGSARAWASERRDLLDQLGPLSLRKIPVSGYERGGPEEYNCRSDDDVAHPREVNHDRSRFFAHWWRRTEHRARSPQLSETAAKRIRRECPWQERRRARRAHLGA